MGWSLNQSALIFVPVSSCSTVFLNATISVAYVHHTMMNIYSATVNSYVYRKYKYEKKQEIENIYNLSLPPKTAPHLYLSFQI